MTRADRTLLLSGGGVLVLIIGVTLVLSSGSGTFSDVPSSRSTASGGAKAAYRLLEASGYRVSRWEVPPALLTDPPHTTYILAEPIEPPSPADQAAVAQFLDRGGQVIATGPFGALLLGGLTTSEAPSSAPWARATAAAPSSLGRAAPEITLAVDAVCSPDWTAAPLYIDADGDTVVAAVAVGAGRAWWWASATPLSNAGLPERGNLEFFLASLGPPADRRVIFDEYFHGDRPSIAGTILHSSAKWVFLQLGLVALLVGTTYVRRSGPIVPVLPRTRLSPLEFVRTLGALYGRAEATPVVLEAAEARARDRLARRFGVPRRSSVDQIAHAAALRTGTPGAAIGEALRAIETAQRQAFVSVAQTLPLAQALAAALDAVDPHPSKEPI